MNDTSKNKVLLIVILLIICLAGLYIYRPKQTAVKVEDASTKPIPSVMATPTKTEIPSNWEEYKSEKYSFLHPVGLPSDKDAAGTTFESIRYRYMGPKQTASGRTQTELFDGYTFTVIKRTDYKLPLTEVVDSNRKSLTETCSENLKMSDVKEVSVPNAKGLQYSVTNCLSDYTVSYLVNGKDIYEVIQTYVGDSEDEEKYKDITKQIFSTLQF